MTDDSPRFGRRRLLRAGGALALASLGGCVLSTEPYTATEERSFDPGDADAVAVVAEDGDVTLSAGEGDSVTGTVRTESRSGRDALDEASVATRTEDGTFVVEADVPDDANVTVHFDLAVPDGLAVERAVAVNGEVSVSDVAGDATCRTRNGDATAENVDGYVTVESTNGSASARGTTGVDGADTTNGDVRADVSDLRGDVALDSTNGDVTAAVDPDLTVAVEFETVNGDVTVQGLDLTASESDERTVRGQLGEGDPEHTLVAETTNGDVTVRSL